MDIANPSGGGFSFYMNLHSAEVSNAIAIYSVKFNNTYSLSLVRGLLH